MIEKMAGRTRYRKFYSRPFASKKVLLITLIYCLGLGSCRSTVMPCPKISSSQQKSGLFSDGGNSLKYDRKGRIKK